MATDTTGTGVTTKNKAKGSKRYLGLELTLEISNKERCMGRVKWSGSIKLNMRASGLTDVEKAKAK